MLCYARYVSCCEKVVLCYASYMSYGEKGMPCYTWQMSCCEKGMQCHAVKIICHAMKWMCFDNIPIPGMLIGLTLKRMNQKPGSQFGLKPGGLRRHQLIVV